MSKLQVLCFTLRIFFLGEGTWLAVLVVTNDALVINNDVNCSLHDMC